MRLVHGESIVGSTTLALERELHFTYSSISSAKKKPYSSIDKSTGAFSKTCRKAMVLGLLLLGLLANQWKPSLILSLQNQPNWGREAKQTMATQKALNKMNLIKRREQTKSQSITKTTLYSLPKLHIGRDPLFLSTLSYHVFSLKRKISHDSLTRQSTILSQIQHKSNRTSVPEISLIISPHKPKRSNT